MSEEEVGGQLGGAGGAGGTGGTGASGIGHSNIMQSQMNDYRFTSQWPLLTYILPDSRRKRIEKKDMEKWFHPCMNDNDKTNDKNNDSTDKSREEYDCDMACKCGGKMKVLKYKGRHECKNEDRRFIQNNYCCLCENAFDDPWDNDNDSHIYLYQCMNNKENNDKNKNTNNENESNQLHSSDKLLTEDDCNFYNEYILCEQCVFKNTALSKYNHIGLKTREEVENEELPIKNVICPLCLFCTGKHIKCKHHKLGTYPYKQCKCKDYYATPGCANCGLCLPCAALNPCGFRPRKILIQIQLPCKSKKFSLQPLKIDCFDSIVKLIDRHFKNIKDHELSHNAGWWLSWQSHVCRMRVM